MSLKDEIVNTFWRIAKRLSEVDYATWTRRLFGGIGVVLHKVLFDWLMPKRYRLLSKRQIFEIIFKSDTPAGKRFDVWLLVLIVANIVLLVLDTVMGTTDTLTSGLHSSFSTWLVIILEWGFTLLFTFEYYLRVYCLNHPMRYVFSFWGIIDFLSTHVGPQGGSRQSSEDGQWHPTMYSSQPRVCRMRHRRACMSVTAAEHAALCLKSV